MNDENAFVVLLAQIHDADRANELLAIIGDGAVASVETAGAAIELYNLGTGATYADAVEGLRGSPDIEEPGSAAALGWQWLQENHPELF